MKSRPLNLLDSLQQEQNQWDQIANWALTIGRWIVILTEIVVIGALIFRFNIDKQISLLRNNVEANRNTLMNMQRQEKIFRHTQKQLNLISQSINRQHDYADLLLTVAKSIPSEGIALNQIQLEPSRTPIEHSDPVSTTPLLKLTGTADKEEVVSGFVHQLRLSGQFTRVIISNLLVEVENSERVNFQLTAHIDTTKL